MMDAYVALVQSGLRFLVPAIWPFQKWSAKLEELKFQCKIPNWNFSVLKLQTTTVHLTSNQNPEMGRSIWTPAQNFFIKTYVHYFGLEFSGRSSDRAPHWGSLISASSKKFLPRKKSKSLSPKFQISNSDKWPPRPLSVLFSFSPRWSLHARLGFHWVNDMGFQIWN